MVESHRDLTIDVKGPNYPSSDIQVLSKCDVHVEVLSMTMYNERNVVGV